MGILDSMTKVAAGLGTAKSIHQNIAYFQQAAQQATQGSPASKQTLNRLTFQIPSSGQVNEWILSHGLAPPHSQMQVFSQYRKEGEGYALKDGTWYVNLYFTKPGKYELTALWNEKIRSEPLFIVIS